MEATALLRAFESFGLPRATPRAFAAARAAFVRVLIIARSFSASAANRCRMNGSTSAPKLSDHEGHAVSHQAADEVNVATEPVQLCDGHRAPLAPCFAQRSRKLRAPLEGVGALAGLNLNEDAASVKPSASAKRSRASFCASSPRPERPCCDVLTLA